ncbi:hypothetical protein K9N68_04280 [Kovacikia minuta CCNUW1]|uniref:hypothetical protein n=1 Tax=Kovacikia minuta TaxID=2931930 RepID=UPI001CC9AD30|nr:hypothetical protein [Kovacikia minuta]UBF27190.1 hypothetical protein K9N68_04280 [Kovacikia minuta CCNUW1]
MSLPTPDQTQRHLLAEALQLSRYLLNSGSDGDPKVIQKRQKRLRQIQDALKAFAHPIQRDRLPVQQIPLEIRQVFVKSALLVTRYAQIGGTQWQGTISSPTLSQYQPDPIPDRLLTAQAIEQLCRVYALPESCKVEFRTLLQSDRSPHCSTTTNHRSSVGRGVREGRGQRAGGRRQREYRRTRRWGDTGTRRLQFKIQNSKFKIQGFGTVPPSFWQYPHSRSGDRSGFHRHADLFLH